MEESPKETDQTDIFLKERKRKRKELKATKTKAKEEHEYDFYFYRKWPSWPCKEGKTKEIHWTTRRWEKRKKKAAVKRKKKRKEMRSCKKIKVGLWGGRVKTPHFNKHPQSKLMFHLKSLMRPFQISFLNPPPGFSLVETRKCKERN